MCINLILGIINVIMIWKYFRIDIVLNIVMFILCNMFLVNGFKYIDLIRICLCDICK